ncbi:MAG: hydrolase 1, exosortase A system-associated [Sphingomonadales bacterium]|nr:hydrolase 1, exosortase A system-associated [Sphingomonadales bacterium]
MSRRHFTFNCRGTMLAGTLDTAPSKTGLLIVSGGNEVRSGPWSGHAQLAERIANSGFPVMRFDRRGVGDSEGENTGFLESAPDIAAALRAFRAHVPTLKSVVAYGNCDAASTLMRAHGEGCDALVLANPWTFESEEPATEEPAVVEPVRQMTPQLLRSHYLRRLADPRALWRLMTGKVALDQLASSLKEAAQPAAKPTSLAEEMAAGLAVFTGPTTILIAERDRTAQAFLSHWDKADGRLRRCPEASHSFVEPQARIWLQGQILAALRSVA